MKKLIAVTILCILFVLTLMVREAKADTTNQYGQYGGSPPSLSLIVDKLVAKPLSSQTKGGTVNLEFVDNISASDIKFKPGQVVTFQIKIKSNSSDRINGVTVKDFLPSYVTPVEGPGDLNVNDRTISFNAGDFFPGDERIFTLKMKINDKKDLPSDQSIICPINRVEVRRESAFDDDTAQFCIEKSVSTVTVPGKGGVIPQEIPSTGAETVIVLGQFLALGGGLLIKKFSKN